MTDRHVDDIPDDDPDVVAGMKRLAELRELEDDVAEFSPVRRRP